MSLHQLTPGDFSRHASAMQQALLSNDQLVGRISRQGICCDSAVIKRFLESEDGACLAKEL